MIRCQFVPVLRLTMPFKLIPLALSVLLIACQAEQEVPEEILRPVRYVEVSPKGTAQKLTFAGTTRAGLESRISFKVSGTLKAKHVKVGDQVNKGQLLFELDPRDYEIGVQQAASNLASTVATARNAQSNYDRTRLLYENNNASLNELEAARANAESAEAARNSAAKQLESAKNQLDYSRLYSPDDCAVASIAVQENENVGATQQVAQLNCGDEPEVEISLPEIYIAQVREGDKASIEFDAKPGANFSATVTEVSVSSQAGSAFPVIVKLDKQDSALRAGMAAEVSLMLSADDQHSQVIYLPSQAVGEDRQGRFVWLVTASDEEGIGLINRRAVNIGKLTTAGLEIVSGLQEGENVVTAGTTFLAQDMRVKFN